MIDLWDLISFFLIAFNCGLSLLEMRGLFLSLKVEISLLTRALTLTLRCPGSCIISFLSEDRSSLGTTFVYKIDSCVVSVTEVIYSLRDI